MGEMEALESGTALFEKDIIGIHPRDDDLMVITVRRGNLEIKKVLIDQGRCLDILYLDIFERLYLDLATSKISTDQWWDYQASKCRKMVILP